MMKKCSQKFDLRVRFITLLNAFARVGACASNSTPLLKGPVYPSINLDIGN